MQSEKTTADVPEKIKTGVLRFQDKITLDLMADPAYRDLIKVPDLKGSYPAHAYYLVRINKSIHDVEEDLICGGKGSVTWSLEGGPELKLDYKKEKPCQHKEILGRFHFRYQAADLKKPQPIIIRAKVQDGYGGAGEGVLKVDLAPNRPPCVLGTDPPFFAKTAGANHVAVISAKGLRFEATHLNDDVLLGTRFSWSMRLAGEKAFVVLPGEGTAAFQMPPWFRLPGDQFELRMRVRDSMSGLPACGDASLCAPYPGLPAGCYQGITWKVRML